MSVLYDLSDLEIQAIPGIRSAICDALVSLDASSTFWQTRSDQPELKEESHEIEEELIRAQAKQLSSQA